MYKYSEEFIERDIFLEKKLGISNLQIYAYRHKNVLKVTGKIESDGLKKDISFALVGYDKNNDIILTEKNSGYGNFIVSSRIKPNSFFNEYPFGFSYGSKVVNKVKKIKVYPVEED